MCEKRKTIWKIKLPCFAIRISYQYLPTMYYNNIMFEIYIYIYI